MKADLEDASRTGGLFTRAARAQGELAFLERIEDWKLLLEIGRAAEAGEPLSISTLHRLAVASHAVVERRVRRLRNLGLVVQTPSAQDARVLELRLSAEVYRAFNRYLERLRA